MKEFFSSKSFTYSMIVVGLVLLIVVIVQTVSIVSLSSQKASLSARQIELSKQENKYNQIIEDSQSEDFVEKIAKEELGKKNPDETVVSGK